MTKQQIIDNHTFAVNELRKARDYRPTSEADEAESTKVILALEREVSILGQIHNPRISHKAKVSLGLV